MLDPSSLSWQLWNRWDLAAISIIVHLLFIFFFISSSFIKPKKVDFRSKGIVIGFIVALYFEMYGIPLSIYLIQPLFSEYMISFYPVVFPLRLLGSAMIFAGFLIMYLGWKKIHASRESLVCTGIYGYVRHPQYIGLALLTLGQLVQWPTLTGILLWPPILFIYYKLALSEEKHVEAAFGNSYLEYKEKVPMFIPKLRREANAGGI